MSNNSENTLAECTLFNCILVSGLLNNESRLEKFKAKPNLLEFWVCEPGSDKIAWIDSLVDEDSNDPYSLQVKYMICVNEKEKQIIVAFRSTKSFNDFLIDVKLNGKMGKCQGRFHAGIYSRSECIPIGYFVRKIIEEDYEVVFTGHSLGAAVGALVAVRVLLHDEIYTAKKKNVRFIGFGSPAFADSSFKEFIESQHKENFRFYINKNDVIVTAFDVLLNIIYENEDFQKDKRIKECATVFFDIILPNETYNRFDSIKNVELIEFIKKENDKLNELNCEIIKRFEEESDNSGFIKFSKLIELVMNLNPTDKSNYITKYQRLINKARDRCKSDKYKKFIELIKATSTVVRSMVPNYIHFGELYYLEEKIVKKEFKSKIDLKHYIRNHDEFAVLIDNHYSENYSEKITRNLRGKNVKKVFSEKTLTDFNLPRELTKVASGDEKNDNSFSVEFIRTEVKTDVFFKFFCNNSEYISSGSLEVDGGKYFAKKITKDNEFKSVHILFSIPNENIKKAKEAKLNLVTHFEKKKCIIDLNLIKIEELDQKQLSIEDMPVDLLYMYALNYIIMLKSLDNESCEELKNHLKEICRIWLVDSSKKHEFSDEELNGVLFSYLEDNKLEFKEQRFNTNLVVLTDYLCEQNLEKLVQNVLPTCYYLKQKQSTFMSLDNMRSFFLSINNGFKRIACDNGYVDKIKLIKATDFNNTLPYAGFYEQKLVDTADENKFSETKELETVRLNKKIREIFKKGYSFGIVGSKNSGKSTFVEKILSGAVLQQSNRTTQTDVYLSKSNSDVVFDYPHFDSAKFSHRLEFIFSKKLLNFVFMICDAKEKMKNTFTMNFFNLLKNGYEFKFVVLLNWTDMIVTDFFKNQVVYLKEEVIEKCGFEKDENKKRIQIIYLKEIDAQFNELILSGDNLCTYVSNVIMNNVDEIKIKNAPKYNSDNVTVQKEETIRFTGAELTSSKKYEQLKEIFEKLYDHIIGIDKPDERKIQSKHTQLISSQLKKKKKKKKYFYTSPNLFLPTYAYERFLNEEHVLIMK